MDRAALNQVHSIPRIFYSGNLSDHNEIFVTILVLQISYFHVADILINSHHLHILDSILLKGYRYNY